MATFTAPQITFISAEDSPTPGGEANGVWNRLPQMPWTVCGMALTAKAPAINVQTSKQPRACRASMLLFHAGQVSSGG